MIVQNVEVRRNAYRWVILLADADSELPNRWLPIASYRRKRDAVLVARFYAKLRSDQLPSMESVELVIKDRRGRIKEKNTYGYDPEASQG